MDTWTQQMGFPIITLERDNSSSNQPSSHQEKTASARWSALTSSFKDNILLTLGWVGVWGRTNIEQEPTLNQEIATSPALLGNQPDDQLNNTMCLPGWFLWTFSLTSPSANLKISLSQLLRSLSGAYLSTSTIFNLSTFHSALTFQWTQAGWRRILEAVDSTGLTTLLRSAGRFINVAKHFCLDMGRSGRTTEGGPQCV